MRLKGAMSAHKTTQGSRTETRKLLVGKKEKDDLPVEGSLIYLSSKSIIFHKKQTLKNELVTRPAAEQVATGTKRTPGLEGRKHKRFSHRCLYHTTISNIKFQVCDAKEDQQFQTFSVSRKTLESR